MKTINGQTLKRMLYGGRVRLAACVEELNALNVFPVPDGDTGSNMLKTMDFGWQAVAASESDSAAEVMSAFANGAVLGARGNSGVILSQIFRGIAKGFAGQAQVDAALLSTACKEGTKAAYSAVVKPVEGTILTVFREASAVETATEVEEWFTCHIDAAATSLRHTPDLLPALKEANVVDSGGAGYLRLVEGMLEGLTGEELAFTDVESVGDTGAKAVDFSDFTRDSVLEFGYCTEFFLRLQTAKTDVDNFDDEALKGYLESVGDSLVYVRMDDLVKVHVHTKTPGQVLGECQKYGEFLSMKIENMSLQHEEQFGQEKKAETLPKKHLATVTVAMSEGMKQLFEEGGADAVILGGACTNPSTGEFLQAFRGLNADAIIVMPNNSNVLMAAQSAAKEYAEERADVRVLVLPTKTMQAGYAALLVATDSEDADGVYADMEEAVENATCLSLTFSVRDTSVGGIEIHKDDHIGFLGKELCACAPTREECLKQLFVQVEDLEDKEIITVMYGADATDEDRELVQTLAEELCPDAELLEYDCGQELYCLLISLE